VKGVAVHGLSVESRPWAEAWLDPDGDLVLRGFAGEVEYHSLLERSLPELASLRVVAGPGTLLPYLDAAIDERIPFGFERDQDGRLLFVVRRDRGERIGVAHDGDGWRSAQGTSLNQPLFGSLSLPSSPPGPRSRPSLLAASSG
jgi:hypothetical protein